MPKKKRKSSKKVSSNSYFARKNQNDLIALLATAIIAVSFIFLLINNNPQGKKQIAQPTPNPYETRVILGQQNGSYETGVALLTEKDGKTTVALTVNGQPKGVAQPAHIHVGSCPNPGTVLYPLNSIINGVSTTVLNVKLIELMKKLPLAINVHESATQMGKYVSCGNFVK